MVVTGLDNLLKSQEVLVKKGKLGLLYNQASVNSCFVSTPELIASAFPNRLRTLFGPQHGVSSTEQDNMVETDHGVHRKLGLPVYSLYSEVRRPTPKMLEKVDSGLIDLQDIGTRVYTFATTALYMIEICAKQKKPVVILDRPNPITGNHIEGNVLNEDFASFVGPYPLPMRHGMTMGELMTFL